MRTQLRILTLLIALSVLSVGISSAQTTRTVPGDAATIQAAINASATGDIVQLIASHTYTEAVTINVTNLTLQGADATSLIHPSSGSGITVSANGVTIKNLTVTSPSSGISANGVSNLTINGVNADGSTGSGAQLTNVATAHVTNSSFSNNLDEGLNAVGGSSYTLSGVTADGNGSVANGSGVNLKGITGPSSVGITSASNNHNHGLSVGDGSTNVTINGGTFTGNGQPGNTNTGAGINIIASGGNKTSNITVNGIVNSSTNKSAGIYIFAQTDSVNNVTIG